ncbi:hypothetical protein BBK14_17130 [Parafrankia soli]|uniref:Uncharacterized protein n=1 Tax=Parafrankia soli TaxID=2599596 RepID=A0A1S1Q8W3_9ACTN|nr:hypothetical protein [Parafrankia soli]OHV29542.1 hypothetical protein BBK14_17130 [Parafrankia soli]
MTAVPDPTAVAAQSGPAALTPAAGPHPPPALTPAAELHPAALTIAAGPHPRPVRVVTYSCG